MAITITANLDASGVKTGASQAAASLENLANKSEVSNDKLDQVANELFADLAKLKGQTDALKASLVEMGDDGSGALDEIADSSKKAEKSIGGIAPKANLSQKITAVATAYMAVADIVKKVAEFAKKADEAINALAERGNPAAIELQKSISGLKTELLEIAEDPAFQDMLQGFADVIREDVIPAIKAIPETWVSVQDTLESGFASIGESLGLFAEGTSEVMKEIQDGDAKIRVARLKQVEADKAARQEKESLKQIESELTRIQEDRLKVAFQGVLDQIDSEERLRKAIEGETEAIKERAKEGKLSDEERKRGLSKIEQAESRITTIRANNARAEVEASKAATKEFADGVAERERLKNAESLENEKLAAAEVDRQRRVHQASIDLDRKAIDDRKRLLGGKDVNGAEQLLKGQDPAAVRKAFAERQAAEAEQQARRKAAADGDNSPADNRRDEREIAKQRQKALGNSMRQFDRGEANPEAVRAAQQGLADASVKAAFNTGKLSRETAIALGESTRELIAIQNEQEQLTREVENLKKLAMAAANQGQRRRAQNAGARQ